MAARSLVLNRNGEPYKKPRPWPVQPSRVAPEYRWVWNEYRVLLVPFWEGAGEPRSYGVTHRGRPAETTGWEWDKGDQGIGYRLDSGSDDLNWPANPDQALDADIPMTIFLSFDLEGVAPTSNAGFFGAKDGTSGTYWSVRNRFGGLRLLIQNGGFNQVSSGDAVVGTDTSIAVVRTPGNLYTFYINGVEVGSDTNSALPGSTPRQLVLGKETADRSGEHTPGIYHMVGFWMGYAASADQIAQLHNDPYGAFRPAERRLITVPAATGVTTLTADPGTYAISGADADLTRALLMDGESGSYALSGQDADLFRDLFLDAESGAYSLSGPEAELTRALLMDAVAGSYAIAGAVADLLVGADVIMSADPGSYALTGGDADLLRQLVLTADAGVYTVDGADASLLRDLLLSADPGAYSITGSQADLLRALRMTAESGDYAITGATADFLRGFVMEAEAGTYIVNGSTAILVSSEGEAVIVRQRATSRAPHIIKPGVP